MVSDNAALSGSSQAHRFDECRKRSGLLPSTRVVEEEAGERWAPIVEHAHECTAREVRRHAFLVRKGETHAIDPRADHYLHVIDDQRSVHCDGEGLIALVELPPVYAGRAVSKVDAAVAQQIAGRRSLDTRTATMSRSMNSLR